MHILILISSVWDFWARSSGCCLTIMLYSQLLHSSLFGLNLPTNTHGDGESPCQKRLQIYNTLNKYALQLHRWHLLDQIRHLRYGKVKEVAIIFFWNLVRSLEWNCVRLLVTSHQFSVFTAITRQKQLKQAQLVIALLFIAASQPSSISAICWKNLTVENHLCNDILPSLTRVSTTNTKARRRISEGSLCTVYSGAVKC